MENITITAIFKDTNEAREFLTLNKPVTIEQKPLGDFVTIKQYDDLTTINKTLQDENTKLKSGITIQVGTIQQLKTENTQLKNAPQTDPKKLIETRIQGRKEAMELVGKFYDMSSASNWGITLDLITKEPILSADEITEMRRKMKKEISEK